MKNFIFLSMIALIAITSCDKVKEPLPKKNIAVGTNFITSSNSTRSNYRKVFLEDYTGHTCGNCPAAAIVSENLSEQYKDSLVAIAVHAGFFSKINSPDYLTSFTCTPGNDWDAASGFGISAAGNPNGMIDRRNFPGDGLILKETKWPTCVPIELKRPFTVKLDVTTNYDPTAKALNTDVKATFKTAYTNSVKLSVILIEDSIIDNQKDYSKNPDLVHNYVFMHVLRDGINGSWGDMLKSGPINANDSTKLSYPNYAVKTTFNDKHLYVVAFAYDATTREVLQAEKVKIR